MPKPTYARKDCLFCRKHISFVDYKDINLLSKYTTHWGQIEMAKKTGTCHKHQRLVSASIKQARHLALMPFTTK